MMDMDWSSSEPETIYPTNKDDNVKFQTPKNNQPKKLSFFKPRTPESKMTPEFMKKAIESALARKNRIFETYTTAAPNPTTIYSGENSGLKLQPIIGSRRTRNPLIKMPGNFVTEEPVQRIRLVESTSITTRSIMNLELLKKPALVRMNEPGYQTKTTSPVLSTNVFSKPPPKIVPLPPRSQLTKVDENLTKNHPTKNTSFSKPKSEPELIDLTNEEDDDAGFQIPKHNHQNEEPKKLRFFKPRTPESKMTPEFMKKTIESVLAQKQKSVLQTCTTTAAPNAAIIYGQENSVPKPPHSPIIVSPRTRNPLTKVTKKIVNEEPAKRIRLVESTSTTPRSMMNKEFLKKPALVRKNGPGFQTKTTTSVLPTIRGRRNVFSKPPPRGISGLPRGRLTKVDENFINKDPAKKVRFFKPRTPESKMDPEFFKQKLRAALVKNVLNGTALAPSTFQ